MLGRRCAGPCPHRRRRWLRVRQGSLASADRIVLLVHRRDPNMISASANPSPVTGNSTVSTQRGTSPDRTLVPSSRATPMAVPSSAFVKSQGAQFRPAYDDCIVELVLDGE
jgi:hypothetical protein